MVKLISKGGIFIFRLVHNNVVKLSIQLDERIALFRLLRVPSEKEEDYSSIS